MIDWPDGVRLFEHFRDLPGALRLTDVQEYIRSLGFSPELLPFGTFLGLPMRYGEKHVGSLFLAEKEGGEESTDEDGEFLVLFASQAATAIANARTYQAEQRARTEEIMLSVPDGRSVTTLVNCTPIHSETGEVLSVVVTMQDLAPIQELERLRTAFISMVSHELRAPLTSIKGSAATLMEESPGLDPAETREFYRIIMEQTDHVRASFRCSTTCSSMRRGMLRVSQPSWSLQCLIANM